MLLIGETYEGEYLFQKTGDSDHRFEWTRAEFRAWTEHICETFGYSCQISGIGATNI